MTSPHPESQFEIAHSAIDRPDVRADVWTEGRAKTYAILLLIAFALPLVKTSILMGGNTLLFPWSFWGSPENWVTFIVPASPDGPWVSWTLYPLAAAIALFVARRFGTNARAIALAAIGFAVIGATQFLFLDQSVAYGLLFVVPDTTVQAFLFGFFISGLAIAIGNHLRKDFPFEMLPRVLMGLGAWMTFTLACVRIPGLGERLVASLFEKSTWSGEWPIHALLLATLLYACFGLWIAMAKNPPRARLDLLSVWPRLVLLALPLSYLAVRDAMGTDDFQLWMMEGDSGTMGVLLALGKYLGILYAGVLSLGTGVAASLQSRLWRKFETSEARELDLSPSRIWGWTAPLVLIVVLGIGYLDGGSASASSDDAGQTGIELQPFWKFSAPGPLATTPAASGNRLFFGGLEPHFYALDRQTGQKLWQFDGKSRFLPPVVDEDTVYVGCDDLYIYALDQASGQLVWKYKASNPVAAKLAIHGRRLFAATRAGYNAEVIALDTETGKEQWKFELEGTSVGDPFVKNGIVFVCENRLEKGRVHAIQAHDGKAIWRYDVDDRLHAGPLATNDAVYFGRAGGAVQALDLSGKEVWTFATPDAVRTRPLLLNGLLYVGCDDKKLYAIDVATGTEQWDLEFGGQLRADPIAVGRHVVVFDWRGQLSLIDPATKQSVARFKTSDMTEDEPLIVDRFIYACGTSNVMSALELP